MQQSHERLIQRDLAHVWHPCTQMKDFEQFPPLIVEEAKGSYLYTNQGPVIDAISSWWCKSLGHQHPAVIAAIQHQLTKFEHVIGANTTHPILVELAEHLTHITRKQHVFFASDGSCAVEIALKLALQAQQIQGRPERNQFVALENGYHGETLAALAVSDLGLYKTPFEVFNTRCHMLQGVPYVNSSSDPLWTNCDTHWPQVLQQLNAVKNKVCAIILEPLVQGAGGMRLYSADFLTRLAGFAQSNGIFLISDEIMTGIGRTGEWLAGEHAKINPDMICLSKGLTSGTIPLSCTLVDNVIYDLFYDDYETGKAFLHSHTFSGHALGASAALATLRYMSGENVNQQAQVLGQHLLRYFSEVAVASGQLENIRQCGALVAGDLKPHPRHTRVGYQVYQEGLRHGALLRPLGNTLYWLPPLTTDEATIGKLAEITLNSIEKTYNNY